MSGLGLALLLAAAPAADWRPSPVETARRVAACGFAADEVRASYDRLFDEEVIRVGASDVSDEQLACAAEEALAASYFLFFHTAEIQRRYDALYYALQKRKNLAEAKARLARRGLLAAVPVYQPGRDTLSSIARRLEALCGVRPGTALEPMAGVLTPNADALADERLAWDAFLCLVDVAQVAGVPLAFIGNEAYSTEQ